MKVLSKIILILAVVPFLMNGCSSTPSGTANAGDDFEVLIGDQVTLDGSATTGNLKNILWALVSAPSGSAAALTKESTLNGVFTADVAGDYVIKLTINSGTDVASSDTVTVTAKNVLAVIKNASDSTITESTNMGLTQYLMNLLAEGGKLSAEDSRGAITTYTWSLNAGPAVTMASTNEVTVTFTAPGLAALLNAADQYKWQPFPFSVGDTRVVIRLTVADAEGNTDSAAFTFYLANNGSVIQPTTGLRNVAVNSNVTLQGPSLKANSNTASTDVTDWSWTLTPPSGSSAVFADTGSVNSGLQFPSFVADVAGTYTVAYSSPSASASGSFNMTAHQWVGVGTIAGASPMNPQCGTCHNGVAEFDVTSRWQNTKHATLFSEAFDGYYGQAPEPYLWPFHTVGYDTTAVNTGFDDQVASSGFSLEGDKVTFEEFASMYPDVAKFTNVQCENCHGPGERHSGDPSYMSWSAAQFGVCGQCHMEEAQYVNSAHNSTGVAHGAGRYQLNHWISNEACIRCHNSYGFLHYERSGHDVLAELDPSKDEGNFPNVGCAACHSPHSATNSYQLRAEGDVEMVMDGSTVDAGKAAACYTCHDGFYTYKELDCDTDFNGVADALCTTPEMVASGYKRFHNNPQAPVLEGKGGILDIDNDSTDDVILTENSYHTDQEGFTLFASTGDPTLSKENNKCVTCHMATGPSVEEAGYNKIGGHTFSVHDSASGTELTAACTPCHKTLTELNRMARADYDWDGTVEGIQDEIKGLLLRLTDEILDNLDATGNYLNDSSGTVLNGSEIEVNALSWSSSGATCGSCTSASQECSVACAAQDDIQINHAYWNHNHIAADGSLGIHNAAFAIQLLQQTFIKIGGIKPAGGVMR